MIFSWFDRNCTVVADRIFSESILRAQCTALLGSCVSFPRRPLALSWHVSNSSLLLVSTVHTPDKCGLRIRPHAVGSRKVADAESRTDWGSNNANFCTRRQMFGHWSIRGLTRTPNMAKVTELSNYAYVLRASWMACSETLKDAWFNIVD